MNRILIFLISIGSTFIVALPIFISGPSSTFYATDPDVHYLSNSLSYIQSKTITYNVHPGTPAIVLFAALLLPLRIYTRLFTHTPFIDWSFLNINFIYHFIRISQSIFLGISMCLFLISIYKITRSMTTVCISLLALFVFTPFFYAGSTISAEGTLFFITSLWLLVFTFYLKSCSSFTSFVLIVIAGVALATKFTSMPLTMASIVLFVGTPKTNAQKKLIYLAQAILLIGAVFIFCTWPIRATYPQMYSWISYLATTTETHGGGTKAIFNPSSYYFSIRGLVSRETWAAFVGLLSIFGFVVVTIHKKYSQNISTVILTGSTIVGLLINAKYPLSYYQIVTYTIVVFIASFSIRLLPKIAQAALLIILILPASANIKNSYITINQAAKKTAVLEKYIQEHPPQRAALWVWGRSKDFALLWSRDWASGLFTKQLAKYRPNLFELESNFDFINIDGRSQKPVFSVCWDQLYLQQASVSVFISKYPQKSIKYTALPGTDDMALIESNHCLTKP